MFFFYNGNVFGFKEEELEILRSLNSPVKIQDFLNSMQINFEKNGDTCMSPRMVLKKRQAQCMEGAMFAAAALRVHGFQPLIVDMEAADCDMDHVIAVFQIAGMWGAIGKTNHAVLRYREPVYKTIRELVMSFFHEYFIDDGRKTLRTFSMPVDLSRFDNRGWMTSEEEVWYIPEFLAEVRHKKILTKSQIARLRKADPVEIKAGELVEWK